MSTFKSIVKLALLGGALYGSYKLGQYSIEDGNKLTEEQDISKRIAEIEKKSYKTKTDMDILRMLRFKLDELRS